LSAGAVRAITVAMQRIGILGAGAWGTALALTARRAGRQVIIQAHEPEVVAAIARYHENRAFLPGVSLDAAIAAVSRPADAVGGDAVLLTVPAQHLRAVLAAAAPDWPAGVPAVICAKGIEQGSGLLMSEVVAAMLPSAPVAVLSGPSFAREVALDLPTAVTLACADAGLRRALPDALATPHFRIYSTDDVVGAEIGGAVKNVIAIACGIIHGRRFGDNARAALITRGLAEMARLADAMGARAETLMGLSGLGDLVLTCNAMQSRNFSLGVALGRGETLAAIMGARSTVAEGVHTAGVVVEVARRRQVEMPICWAVDAVLNRGADLETAISGLMTRPPQAEGWRRT
jgi:glycerol-3-phosphate dehydrogenase (NAD(P)+)